MFPRDAEQDAVKQRHHCETGTDGDGDKDDGVLAMEDSGERARGIGGPVVPAERHHGHGDADQPDDRGRHFGRRRANDGVVAEGKHDGEEPVEGDGQEIEDGAEDGEDGDRQCEETRVGRGVCELHPGRYGNEEAEERPDHADGEVSSGQTRDEQVVRCAQLLEPEQERRRH